MKPFLLALAILFCAELCLSEESWPTFYYYSNLDEDPQILSEYDTLEAPFSSDKQTIFIIHGYKSSYLSSYIYDIKNALLENTEGNNVILVDWAQGASNNIDMMVIDYPTAVNNTRTNAERITNFILSNNLDISKVYCIGHSLGAHTCGQVGKNLDGKIGRITGLDPAGASFSKESSIRLKPTDALFVDVIHSSYLGASYSCGDLDFFPNMVASLQEDNHQPGCDQLGPDMMDMCDHIASCVMYAQSTLIECKFTSTRCDDPVIDERDFFVDCNELCSTQFSPMGYYASRNVASGEYVVEIGETYCEA